MAEPQNYNDADDPYRAIRVGDAGGSEANKWGLLLTRFMRLMAAFWLLQGLAQWHAVLTAERAIFETMPQGAALAVIFFAVLDLVAGVGLWLATPWGGVLWLLIASAQIFVATSMPKFFSGGYWLVAINLLLIALYFWLTFEAGRDLEAQRVMERRRRRRSSGQRPPQQKPASASTRVLAFLGGPFIRKKPEPTPVAASSALEALPAKGEGAPQAKEDGSAFSAPSRAAQTRKNPATEDTRGTSALIGPERVDSPRPSLSPDARRTQAAPVSGAGSAAEPHRSDPN
jgi:hypothetical protein